MNFLRADSSWASWCCIALKATASCPSSSLESTADRVLEVAGGDLLGGVFEPLDPLGERPGLQVAADQRQQQGDPARHQDLVTDDRDVADDVGDRRRVDDHPRDAAVVGDGVGRLGDLPGPGAFGARC